MSKVKRAEKINGLEKLFGVLNSQAPGAGDSLREVLHDLNDAAAATAKPKAKAKAK